MCTRKRAGRRCELGSSGGKQSASVVVMRATRRWCVQGSDFLPGPKSELHFRPAFLFTGSLSEHRLLVRARRAPDCIYSHAEVIVFWIFGYNTETHSKRNTGICSGNGAKAGDRLLSIGPPVCFALEEGSHLRAEEIVEACLRIGTNKGKTPCECARMQRRLGLPSASPGCMCVCVVLCLPPVLVFY